MARFICCQILCFLLMLRHICAVDEVVSENKVFHSNKIIRKHCVHVCRVVIAQ